MDAIQFLIDFILHIDVHLNALVNTYGVWIYPILFLIIFCETGLIVTPFLPGDSLLFVAGAIAASNSLLEVHLLVALLVVAAILGDSLNYSMGRHLGLRLFKNPDSKIFRRDHLTLTEQFYQRHGGKTIVLGRFLPIIRTFAPFVGGLGQMQYRRFLAFNVVGALAWIGGFVYVGYFFGNLPGIKQNLSYLIIGIVVVTSIPGLYGIWHQHRMSSRARRARAQA
jgi:membrane-associated protein